MQIPHDFTYVGNLKNNISKQNRNRLTDTESRLMVYREGAVRGGDERGEGSEKYRLVGTNSHGG